jgi:putative peptidoglycan lipid II flippase
MGTPGDWLIWDAMQRISWLALLVGAGVVVYFVVMIAAGLRVRHLRGELF